MNFPLPLRRVVPGLIVVFGVGLAPLIPNERLAMFVAAISVLLAAMSWWIIRVSLIERLARLTEAARRLARGEWQARADLTGQDELAAFARVFNQMAAALEASTAAVRPEAGDSSLVESNVLAVLQWDLAGTITEANDAFLRLTGYSREDLAAGKLRLPEMIPAEHRAAERQAATQLKIGGGFQPYETELLGKDGARLSVLMGGTRLRRDETRQIGFVLDLASRRPVEAALRTSAKRLRSIWENSVDGMRLTDRKGTILAVNHAFCELMEMSSAELVGQPFTVVYAAESNHPQLLREYLERFQRKPAQSYIQPRVTLRSGKVLDVEIIFSELELRHGEPLCLSVYRDITARKQAERALRQQQQEQQVIFNAVPAMIWFKDRDNRILRANQAAARIVGRPEGGLEGQSFFELYAPELARQFHAHDRKVFESGQPLFGMVEHHVTAAGGSHWLQTDRIPYRDERGTVIGVIVFSRDITEQTEAEAQRQAMERKLMETQKLESLGVMAGGIAHDFNNLLTAVLGNTSLAMMHAGEASPLRPYLAKIEKTSLQAADLCRQMLAYSGHGRFAVQHLAVNALIEDMRHLLEISIEKGVVLKFDLADGLPAIVADPAQIRQVVMNLVINSSEAIGGRSGVVRLSTGLMRADHAYLAATYLAPDVPAGDYLFLEVADTGCGMTAETRSKIFDPFFTTKFTGRGLGLAALLGIVRGHRGAVKLDSEPGRGTTIRILLPCVNAPAEALPPAAIPTPFWRGTGTILVIDDEESVRTVAAQLLEAFGFTTLMAENGRAGVELFRSRSTEIAGVLLDMTMPHLSGEQTFLELRQIRPDVRVLLMSGYSEHEAASRLVGQQQAAFIPKPLNPADLNQRLRALLSEAPGARPMANA